MHDLKFTQNPGRYQLGCCMEHYKIPYEIIADHYCNTILLVLEWHFLKGNTCSKEQAHEYLKFLLGTL